MGKYGSIGEAREVTEVVYIQLIHAKYGYHPGEIIAAVADLRDTKGVHVSLWSEEDSDYVNAWSDIGSFRELTEMEVLAYSMDGLIPERSL